MKKPNLTWLLLGASIIFGINSCEKMHKTESTTTSTNAAGDTATVIRKEKETETTTKTSSKADREVQDFKSWVNEKTTRADSNAKEKWPGIKQDFKTRSEQLESKMDSFSADTRREYEAAKARYQAWENRRDTRTSKPLDANTLNTWRKTLLGSYSDLKTMTGKNAREAYLTFMGVVRVKKDHWTQNDWDYVDSVYGQLNDRKREIDNSISTADALKIKTLQAEYLTLEAAADAKDATK